MYVGVVPPVTAATLSFIILTAPVRDRHQVFKKCFKVLVCFDSVELNSRLRGGLFIINRIPREEDWPVSVRFQRAEKSELVAPSHTNKATGQFPPCKLLAEFFLQNAGC